MIPEEQRKSITEQIKEFIHDRFNLDEDKAEQVEVIDNIRRGVEFRGTNLWILMFAIVIASVGLNVNSPAVIIGAMLVSPLMGPIMGIGMSLGINDFELLKKSFKNFAFAVGVSLLVSTIYFLISPVTGPKTEILARTTPTIWDVLIATFGGLAGIVAQSRRDRTSTVIPGVAIATALMPPVCTAGFGLATGNMAYFGGALYLFFINAVFIAFSTFFMVRFLKYRKKEFLDPRREKRVKNSMIVIMTATLVPSIILAYSIVQRAVFENNANTFIDNVLVFPQSKVISSTVHFSSGANNSIDVMLVGEAVSEDVLAAARNQLKQYNLTGTTLTVRQASVADNLNDSEMKSILLNNTQIINEKNTEISKLRAQLRELSPGSLPTASISRELAALWEQFDNLSLSRTAIVNADGNTIDTVLMCVLTTANNKPLSPSESDKLKKWLAERTGTENIKLIVE